LSKPILQEITDYICDLDRDNRVQLLLTYCLGRLFTKEHGRGGDWKALATSIDGRHIADWLRAAVANDEPWLANVDELKRPKKLLKFSDVAGITAEADKAMSKANQAQVVHIAAGNEKLVMQLGDGLYLVRLCTVVALDYESSVMQHCIGNGGYDAALASGRREFLSLRSGPGKPHVTIDIDRDCGYVIEMKGKQNSWPLPQYVAALTPFFQARPKLKFLSTTGVVFDPERTPLQVRALPDGAVIEGDLRISGGDSLVLPANLTVKGDMEIRHIKNVVLPRTLTVGGQLDFEACRLEGKIDNLTVKGWAAFFYDVEHSERSFIKTVKVDHLGFENTQILEMPSTLEVNSLTIADSPISEIGPLGDLKFLRLRGLARITALPLTASLDELELEGMPIRDFDDIPASRKAHFSRMSIDSLPEKIDLEDGLTLQSCEVSDSVMARKSGKLAIDHEGQKSGQVFDLR
jgi:hypothetical protein